MSLLYEANVPVSLRAVHLVSVIIPALNEADGIESAIASVAAQDEPHEIIVVDGGSVDETVAVASRGAHVFRAERGRALQMNAGAAASRGDVLLFLHADTLLPPSGLHRIGRAVAEGHEGGTFLLTFDHQTPLLRLYSYCTRLRTPRFCFGDRGLFVRRDVFDELGAYPVMPLFEDLEMARLLYRRGRFAFLPECVTTSARRFLRYGPLRQQVRNAYLWLHYLAGTDLRRLTHHYAYD